MKKLLTTILSTTLLLASVTSCGSNANSTTNVIPSAPVATDADKIAATGENTLTIAFSGGGKTLDPSAATDSVSAVFVNAAYDQLVTFGEVMIDGHRVANPEEIMPSLAESWEVSDDALEYTFHLDKNAVFTNGDPVNADAVIYSLERVKNSNTSSFLFALTNIESMEKIDDTTVKFYLSKPSTILLKIMQMHIMSIVNPNQLKDVADVDTFLTTKTAGSGAYTIERWDPSAEAILVSNLDYWKGTPNIRKIQINVISESSSRVLFAGAGDVDIALDIPAKDVTTLNSSEFVDVITYDSNSIAYMAMNNSVEPFNNVKVRQALNYALPYNSIIDGIMYGKAKRLEHVVPSAMPGYLDQPSVYSYDVEKAKSLLAEAGYPDGFKFTLLVSNGKSDWNDTAILIQSELAKINVQVTIDKMERPQYLEAIRGDNFQAAIASYTAFVNDPGYFFGNTLNSKGEYNYAHFASDAVDKIFDEAESISDLNKRYDLYKQAQLIVEEQAPWVNLYEYKNTIAISKDIKHFLYFPDGALRFYTIEK